MKRDDIRKIFEGFKDVNVEELNGKIETLTGDVSRLCNLNVRKENQTSEYISCPFCGRKKMNLHYGKGHYHCPACGEAGSMLKQYSVLRGYQGSKAEIVRVIKKEPGITENLYLNFW